jgi:hypothetical protein
MTHFRLFLFFIILFFSSFSFTEVFNQVLEHTLPCAQAERRNDKAFGTPYLICIISSNHLSTSAPYLAYNKLNIMSQIPNEKKKKKKKKKNNNINNKKNFIIDGFSNEFPRNFFIVFYCCKF